MKNKTCKDCKWVERIQTYKYRCLFSGLIFSDNEACEKFRGKTNGN